MTPEQRLFYDLVLACQCNIPVIVFASFFQWALAGNTLISMAHLLWVERAAQEMTKAPLPPGKADKLLKFHSSTPQI